MIKRLFFALTALLLAAALTFGAFAEYDKALVFDLSDLLSDEEESEIEQRAQLLSETYKLDIVLVTPADADSEDLQTYADDFYDSNGFGYGEDKGRGILFIIDTADGKACVSAGDGVTKLFDENAVKAVLDAAEPFIADDNCLSAFGAILDTAEKYLNSSKPGSESFDDYYDYEQDYYGGTYVPQTQRWYNHLSVVPVILGIVIAAAVLIHLYRISVSVTVPGIPGYEVSGTDRLVAQSDTLVGTEHTTRVISDSAQNNE